MFSVLSPPSLFFLSLFFLSLCLPFLCSLLSFTTLSNTASVLQNSFSCLELCLAAIEQEVPKIAPSKATPLCCSSHFRALTTIEEHGRTDDIICLDLSLVRIYKLPLRSTVVTPADYM